jgi:hypothetical protein
MHVLGALVSALALAGSPVQGAPRRTRSRAAEPPTGTAHPAVPAASEPGPASPRGGAGVPQKPAPPAATKSSRAARGVRVSLRGDNPEVVLEGQTPSSTAASSSDGSPAREGEGAAEGIAGAPAGAADPAIGEGAEVPLPLDDGRWAVMCASPCNRRLPREALFRVTAAGAATSSSFSLPAGRPAVTLDVETGQARWYWTGAISAIAGATFIIGAVGPRLALGGSFATVEKVMAGAGVVLVGGGVPLWWFNRTRVAIF